MNLEDVNKLLDAGFSAQFIERVLTASAAPAAPTPEDPAAPEAPAAPAPEAPAPEAPAPEATTDPKNRELEAINQKIAELLGAVQQHNILTISRNTPAQSQEEIARDYLASIINGGVKK